MKKCRVFAELLAVRAIVLFAIAFASSLGLYVTSRGAELRAFKRARANGEYDNPASCPTLTKVEEHRLVDEELDEISGMAASQRQDDVFWVHNDSGDDARIFAIRRDGSLRAEVVLDGVEAHDFEDIAVQGERIYIADTGNNLKLRESVQVLVLDEPSLARGSVKLHRRPRAVAITYEDGRHDVEAIFVDARGDLYLIRKAHALLYLDQDGVYRVSAAELEQQQAVARKVGMLPIGPATAADISADGATLAVRNYVWASWWKLDDGEAPLHALSRRPCRFWLREFGLQGESLTFLPDGSGFLTLSEGKHARIIRYSYGPPDRTD